MCGIAGIIEYERGGVDQDALQAVTLRQSHRGPDGVGYSVRDNVGLGHTRLAIIDLQGGAQPFESSDGEAIITYNGELYNYRELRHELSRKGHSFRSESDTEVVLHSYTEWGKRCVDRFEGMFAFAIADFRKREVFLARDPFGIKPLVYFSNSKRFSFASELQALSGLPGWSGEINLEAVEQYLRLQYIPDPITIFRQTYKLPPGHRLTVRMGEPHVKLERYWEPKLGERNTLQRRVSDVELNEVLRDSVRRHLVADVPFGAFLSGGVDSSLVVGYMTEVLGRPIKTFSIGFDDPDVSELDMARQVARRYGTEHHEEVVSVDALGVLPDIVRHYGEPFGDQSAVCTWYLARFARHHVPMVLSGDGGDELFGGYGRYGAWLNTMRGLGRPAETSPRNSALALARRLWPSRYVTPPCPSDDSHYWMGCVQRFTFPEIEKLWRPEYRFSSDSPNWVIDAALRRTKQAGLAKVQRVDIETFLPADILAKVDIASMAFGLEVRTPILDKRVFRAAARFDRRDLYSLDASGKYEGKLPLKNILAKNLGTDFARRPKQGFELPLESWLYGSPATQAEVRERLLGLDSRLYEWFEPGGVEAAIQARNPVNVWVLLVLDEWLRQTSQPAGDPHSSRETLVVNDL